MSIHICLSHPIKQTTPSYGNRDKVIICDNSSIKKGETANTSSWIFSNNHIGTHIDTPYHFDESGKKTMDYPVDYFFFSKVQLIDIPCFGAKLIDIEDIGKTELKINSLVEILFIRTGYEKFRRENKYWNDNPGLAPELADYFRLYFPNLRCVGFDFISLTSWKFREKGRESHRSFLCPGDNGREILVIEDMALSKINFPISQVVVAPLFVEDGNGGAVTVFAKVDKNS